MNQDEFHLFQDAVQDVTPLPESNRHLAHRPKGAPSEAELARRAAASGTDRPTDNNPLLIPDHITFCDPYDINGQRKDGVQKGVYRQLRLGHYDVKAKLDLHRLTLKEARTAVHDFLQSAHQNTWRTVLIAHGKGAKAIMKSHTWYWLEHHPLVLAWHSATPQLGGAGATLVLVRKPRGTNRG